ncbi:helix-turn-helix domain-containing protein [Oligoflexus tunisiensis]|uniref:helix-turn-helix domain-containing protein n=1 Tax=Oligoflexus tunisiensis TaxID=708132 RepID=UPI00159F1D22|nr:helix-turn-helix domain-containing protein [Oligoflexus tunisiensis]
MQVDARELAETIRDLRKKHGISQGELAQISGVSLPSISRFERGKDTIRLDVLMKILDALGYRLEIKAKEKNNGAG